MRRIYDGPALDGCDQYVTERPVQPDRDDEGETVYATDPEPPVETTVENVPIPGDEADAPLSDGRTTLDDWRGEEQ